MRVTYTERAELKVGGDRYFKRVLETRAEPKGDEWSPNAMRAMKKEWYEGGGSSRTLVLPWSEIMFMKSKGFEALWCFSFPRDTSKRSAIHASKRRLCGVCGAPSRGGVRCTPSRGGACCTPSCSGVTGAPSCSVVASTLLRAAL